MQPLPVPGLKLQTVSDSNGFRSLQSDWCALCERGNLQHVFSSFEWWLSAWTLHAEGRGQQLTLVTGRLDGQLVLVWPMVRDGRVLRMLSSGTLEYRDIIVEPVPRASDWVDQAWNYVRSTVDADIFILQNLRLPNRLAERLRQDSSARPIGGGFCPVIRLDQFEGWDSYAASLPTSLMADQRRQWRRLARDLPDVTFRVVESHAEIQQVMDWISRHKIAWAEARQKNPAWYATDSIWENLKRTARTAMDKERLLMVTLADDQRLVSAGWGFMCGDEFLFHAFAYDADYATYSPSRLLLERIVRVCFDRGIRSFDFMPGEEAYKRTWATDYVRTESYTGPLNWRGRYWLAIAERDPLSKRLLQSLKPVYRWFPQPIRMRMGRVVDKYLTVSAALKLKPPSPPKPPGTEQ
jgi:CelD/BcsL family acetyltransferase involved in cellulose biosynthesis